MGQQRSHLKLGTAGRLWPLHGHGRGSALPGLPGEEQCLASACDGSGNTRLEDGLLHIRNTSSVLAGWWVSNPEAFSAVEKKKKKIKTNHPTPRVTWAVALWTYLLKSHCCSYFFQWHHPHPTPVALSPRDIAQGHFSTPSTRCWGTWEQAICFQQRLKKK